MQAAELSLRLIEDALGDERPAAFFGQRVARYAQHLIDGVDLTCRLLRQLPAPPAEMNARSASQRDLAPSPGLAVLAGLEAEQIDAVTGRLILAIASLPFEIGIEEQLENLRRKHGLADLARREPRGAVPVLDYEAVVSPRVVYGIREVTPCGPEDHLFSTVHQITECWLNIAHRYLAESRVLAADGSWAAAGGALARACDVLPLAVQAGQLLDQMVLVDYHPLRVRLRDGSGAQSLAARRLGPALQEAAGALWSALEGAKTERARYPAEPERARRALRVLVRTQIRR